MVMSDRTYQIRRKFPRKAFRRTLSFMVLGRSEVVEGVEIGEGGISFKTLSHIETDQKIIVNFFLVDGDFFCVRCTARNRQEISGSFICGVSFDDVSVALKRQIRAYVARNVLNSNQKIEKD